MSCTFRRIQSVLALIFKGNASGQVHIKGPKLESSHEQRQCRYVDRLDGKQWLTTFRMKYVTKNTSSSTWVRVMNIIYKLYNKI